MEGQTAAMAMATARTALADAIDAIYATHGDTLATKRLLQGELAAGERRATERGKRALAAAGADLAELIETL